MGENYLDMVPVIVIFFALGILLSRLGGIGGIVVRIKRIICKLMGHSLSLIHISEPTRPY